jgi:hypothetical protein
VLEQSSDGTIPVKLLVSTSFLGIVSDCLNTSGVCNSIFYIINRIVCDKKNNKHYKHKHIHSLFAILKMILILFLIDRCIWGLWAVVLWLVLLAWENRRK